MSDFINREEALHALCEAVHSNDGCVPCRNQLVSCRWTGTRTQAYAERILAIPPADVVPWSWLEDFADESWASSGVYRFLIKAKEAYKRDRA